MIKLKENCLYLYKSTDARLVFFITTDKHPKICNRDAIEIVFFNTTTFSDVVVEGSYVDVFSDLISICASACDQ